VITTSAAATSTAEPVPTLTSTLDANASALDLAQTIYGERLITYISIPALDLLAPVTPAGWESTDLVRGTPQWDSPGAAVGWALSSALPGDDANIILFGHNNIESSIFRDLSDLTPGDQITLQTEAGDWVYVVSEVVILPAVTEEESQAIVDSYLLPGRAPRLTLLSCYPPEGNTQRVVVTAYPNNLP
jgi:LPXTG-site transpeptidase (sortase) family protein